MNELELLKIINNQLSDNSLLGSDCAELSLNIPDRPFFVTQDTLVEEIHFSMNFITPYQLGIKSVAVNISDLCAALAIPQYITISLSMPQYISSDFVKQFYQGVNDACSKFGCKVAGGDLTRSEKITISICAFGQQETKIIIGRDKAKKDDIVFLCGQVGASSLGLLELIKNPKTQNIFTEAHLNPKISFDSIKTLTKTGANRIAAMDTSDGLADAVFKIGQASGTALAINAEKIPIVEGFKEKCFELGVNEQEPLLFGAEDFSLLFTIAPEYAPKLPTNLFTKIGKVTEDKNSFIQFGEEKTELNEKLIKEKTYNHFKKEGKDD